MAEERVKELSGTIDSAARAAYAIFADSITDIDGQAAERTRDRLALLEQLHGEMALFGVMGSWAQYYARAKRTQALQMGIESPTIARFTVKPEPKTNEDRADNLSKQFFNAMLNNDLESAEAIFQAARTVLADETVRFYGRILQTVANVE